MSQIGEIRRMREVDGYSIKEIARRLNVSRNTVRRVLREDRVSNNEYVRSEPHRPKLGPYVEILEEMIEANEKLPPRERRSATALYEELQGHGYSGAADSVRRYVKRWREEHGGGNREGFIPLVFGPGEAVQFDWSREVARIDGVDTFVKAAHMRLCHSRLFLVQVFPLERQEMMLEALRRSFHFFGGVPRRLVVDNMKVAVLKILTGKNRLWQEKFEGFCAHYLLDPRACTPGRGHEKGQVEKQVDTVRNHFFKPVPRAGSIAELNERLVSQCVEWAKRTAHPEVRAKSIWDMWGEEEEGFLTALPGGDFDCCRIEDEKRVDSCCTVAFDARRYSVPSRYVGLRVSVKGYAEEVKVVFKGRQIAVHERLFGKGEPAYDPLHYLDILEKKPGALENGRPFANWRLPDVFETARGVLRSRMADGEKQYVKLLLLLRDYSVDDVAAALELALERGTPQAGCVENILRRFLDTTPPPQEPQTTIKLATEPAGEPGVYDECLRRGVSR